MEVNKVVYEGEPLIDLTSDSVTEDTLLEGATAHDKSGRQISGGAVIGKGNLTIKRNGVIVGSFNANETTNKEIDITVNDLTADEKTVLSKIEFERDNGGDHVTINADDLYILGNKRVLTGADVGVATGVASLDSSGRVPSSQLPSYVDDTIEGTLSSDTVFKNASGTTITGETGKIYVDTTTNKTYRWSGSKYVEISASLALGDTSSTAFAGDKGKTAYEHSQKTSGNPHKVTKSDVGLSNVANERQYSASNPPPTATGTTAGITVVYPAASCTTFSSDSGTVTPAAVQKGAKQFAITRPSASTNKAIVRYSNTTGDVQNSTIKIEDVTNSKNGEAAQVISVPAAGGTKKMVYGYCTDQTDGTSFIGGLFDASATSFPYNQGLAIGGSSGNLLWKGVKVATASDIPSVPSVGNGTLTIKRNGTQVGTFSANQSSAASVNIEVPTNLSELGDDPDYQTVSQTEKDAWNAKSNFSGKYSDLSGKPSIPSTLADLGSDPDYQTVTEAEKAAWNNKVDPTQANQMFAGAFRKKAQGTQVVSIDDVSSVPHDVNVSVTQYNPGANIGTVTVANNEYDGNTAEPGDQSTIEVDGNNARITGMSGKLCKQTMAHTANYTLSLKFSYTGTVTGSRPNEIHVYCDSNLIDILKLTNGSTTTVTLYGISAGSTLRLDFYAEPTGGGTISNFVGTFENITLTTGAKTYTNFVNGSAIPSVSPSMVVTTGSSWHNVAVEYNADIGRNIQKITKAILALGGSV
jgi:hypothetical protein